MRDYGRRRLPEWIFTAGLLLCCPALLRAGVTASYSQTTGSNGFDSNTIDGSLDLGSGFYLGASYNEYHSDFSSGTLNTYYGRFGQYGTNGSWRLFGSVTPEVSQYQEVSGGGDFSVAIFGRDHSDELPVLPSEVPGPAVNAPPRWHPNPRLDFIGGYARDMFKDEGQDIDENDFTGGLGFNLFKTYLSGTFTKSLYDQEINGTFNPRARLFSLGYTPTVIPGYPDETYTGSVDQTLLPGWWILGSYTHLKYKAGPDDVGNLYSAGTGVTLFHMIFATLMYTWYVPTGQERENFVSIGGGLQF